MFGGQDTPPTKCAKWTAVLFNLAFLVLGLAALVTSGAVVSDEVGKLSGRGLSTGLLIVGVLIVVTGSLGAQASCTGRLRQCSFFYIVVMLFVAMATGIMCSLVFKADSVKENLSEGWNVADLETKRQVQDSLGCCGFNDPADRAVVPCHHLAEACEPKLEALVDTRMGTLKACAFSLLAFELIGLFSAIGVACATKPRKESVNSYGAGSAGAYAGGHAALQGRASV